jgi:hypothetical protein
VHRGWAHPCVPSLFLILALRLLVVSVLSTSMVIVLPVNVFTNICISPVVASETRAGAFDCCLRLRPPTVPFCTLDRVSPKPKSLRVLVRYLVGGDLPPMLFGKKLLVPYVPGWQLSALPFISGISFLFSVMLRRGRPTSRVKNRTRVPPPDTAANHPFFLP